jgi:hypothetical protein
MSDLDTLLDSTLDDLEDLPQFAVFPAGASKCLATLSSKDVNKKPAIELSFKMVESIELVDPQATAPKEGDQSSSLFFLDNEFGRGKFKAIAGYFADYVGSTRLRDIVEGVKDVEVILVSAAKVDKHDDTKIYLEVKELQVV